MKRLKNTFSLLSSWVLFGHGLLSPGWSPRIPRPDLVWQPDRTSQRMTLKKLSRKTNFVHCFRLWKVVFESLRVGFVFFCDVRLVYYSSPGVSHLNKTEENDFEYLVKHVHFFLNVPNDLSVDSLLNDRNHKVHGERKCWKIQPAFINFRDEECKLSYSRLIMHTGSLPNSKCHKTGHSRPHSLFRKLSVSASRNTVVLWCSNWQSQCREPLMLTYVRFQKFSINVVA